MPVDVRTPLDHKFNGRLTILARMCDYRTNNNNEYLFYVKNI